MDIRETCIAFCFLDFHICLLSALHKNAESLVTTKAEHNGPDQVLASTEHTSSVRNHPVIIRKETVGLGAELNPFLSSAYVGTVLLMIMHGLMVLSRVLFLNWHKSPCSKVLVQIARRLK